MSNSILKPFSPAGTRRERRKQEYQEKILRAAIDLFEKQGCAATTLDEICEKADLSRPTFYSYYPSKHDLILALCDRLWIGDTTQLIEESLANNYPTREFITQFFTTLKQSISQSSVLERELIRHRLLSRNPLDGNHNPALQLQGIFTKLFKSGQKKGDVGKMYPAEFLAEITLGSSYTLMMHWVHDENYPVEKRITHLSHLVQQMTQIQK